MCCVGSQGPLLASVRTALCQLLLVAEVTLPWCLVGQALPSGPGLPGDPVDTDSVRAAMEEEKGYRSVSAKLTSSPGSPSLPGRPSNP